MKQLGQESLRGRSPLRGPFRSPLSWPPICIRNHVSKRSLLIVESIATDNEVETVEAMDFEEAEADATDEEDAEVAEQGTSHHQMTKKNAKVVVWKYIALETDEHGVLKDQDTPVCIVGTCCTRVKTKHSSTDTLYSHLQQHHPKEYEGVHPRQSKGKAPFQRTLQESFKLATKLHPESREHKELTKAIAKDMRPVHSVELPGFYTMVSKLNPRYVLPSIEAILAVLPSLPCIVKFERTFSET